MKEFNSPHDTNEMQKGNEHRPNKGKGNNFRDRMTKSLGIATAAWLLSNSGVEGRAIPPSDSALSIRDGHNPSTMISSGFSFPDVGRLSSTSDWVASQITSSGDTSRSRVTDTPLQQGGDGKRAEAQELSEANIESLRSFSNVLGKNEKARQGLENIIQDKDAMEGFETLMRDKNFRDRALSVPKNTTDLTDAISLLENGDAVSLLRKLKVRYGPLEPVSSNALTTSTNAPTESRTSTDAPSLPIPTNNPKDMGSNKDVAIVGGIVTGGGVGICVLAGAILFYRRHRARLQEAQEAQEAQEQVQEAFEMTDINPGE